METSTPASQYILNVTVLVYNLEYVLSSFQCTVLIKRRGRRGIALLSL